MVKLLALLLLSLISAIDCFTLLPSQLTELQELIKNYTSLSANITNGIDNAICESTPSHIICGASVKYGHKVLQNLPAITTIRPCSVFLASPHCCSQFCRPGNGGTCDLSTGACFCNPSGLPSVCEMIMKTKDTPPALLNNNDNAVLEICKTKCANNPNGCTKPAATTDGIVGTVCMCYCDPAGDGPYDTTPSPSITIPQLQNPLSG